MFERKKSFRLDKFSSRNNPFEFSVSAEQIVGILNNFSDYSIFKRGINCKKFSETTLLDIKSDCAPRIAAENIKNYFCGKDLLNEITGKYTLYWDKKRREYTHEIFLCGEKELSIYLEFGTSSSQKNLNNAFRS